MPQTSRPHDVFQAVADETRRRILRMLADGDMPIGAIAEHFPITRTAVNKHLHVLEGAGLVAGHRVGRETRYALVPEPLLELREWLSFYERYWDSRLAALQKYVEAERDDD